MYDQPPAPAGASGFDLWRQGYAVDDPFAGDQNIYAAPEIAAGTTFAQFRQRQPQMSRQLATAQFLRGTGRGNMLKPRQVQMLRRAQDRFLSTQANRLGGGREVPMMGAPAPQVRVRPSAPAYPSGTYIIDPG